MENHQGIGQTCLTRHDGCFTTRDVDAHGRLASGNRYGNDQLLRFDHVPNESDLTVDRRFFESRLQRINERSARKRLPVSWKRQARYNPRVGRFWTYLRQPGVNQKKNADGKDKHEWADEQPEIQVKVSDKPVKSSSHAARVFSEFEASKKSSPWKTPA